MTPAAIVETEATAAQLLDFEARWPRHSGRKETAIIADLGIAPARYYVELLRAASTLDGQAHDPITAHRVLRRMTSAGRSPGASSRPSLGTLGLR